MNDTEASSSAEPSGLNRSRKIMLGVAIALVAVAAGMYVWKVAAVSAVEGQLAQLQARQAEDRTDLIEQARQLDMRHAEASLRRFSVPFAWSVRRDLMAANLDQIDQYFTELVQMEEFRSAVLASPDGKVIVASDRKKLTADFSSLYPDLPVQAREIQILRDTGGILRASIPILGLNQQLGMVVLEFAPPAFTLN